MSTKITKRKELSGVAPSGKPSMQYQLLNVAAHWLRVTRGVSGIQPERSSGSDAYTGLRCFVYAY